MLPLRDAADITIYCHYAVTTLRHNAILRDTATLRQLHYYASHYIIYYTRPLLRHTRREITALRCRAATARVRVARAATRMTYAAAITPHTYGHTILFIAAPATPPLLHTPRHAAPRRLAAITLTPRHDAAFHDARRH